MGMRAYADTDLTELVTLESDFNNPDEEDDLDGDSGEVAKKFLFVAIEQTELDEDIPADHEDSIVISLVAARFANTEIPLIRIGDEKFLITADFGTKNPTVTSAFHGTSKAAHSAGDPVYLCYDAQSVQVVCEDNEGTDEAGWCVYCLAPDDTPDEEYNEHPDPLSLGNIAFNEKVEIERKLTVPASTAPTDKRDLLHKVNANLVECEI